jgi:type I restriction-modification system DNA methylase subunit
MSEELRQKGYLTPKGGVSGLQVGPFEGFNLGATTLAQLQKAGIIPGIPLGGNRQSKPDALVVDRRGKHPSVELVVEYKDLGELDSQSKRKAVCRKLAGDYCETLNCPYGVISDGQYTAWLYVDLEDASWREIEREDGYPLDTVCDLSTVDGRELVADTLTRIHSEYDPESGKLAPVEAVDPTELAERTWQTIWLASGEDPEACLASFVEILIFKFLSDLGLLVTDPSGVKVDFETVLDLPSDKILKYYFSNVRPEIKRLFPPGRDGTSVINGIVLNPANTDHGRLFSQILTTFEAVGPLKRIDPEFKSRIFERFLKESISQKNWGQYFTPRNVVKAMVEMSGIDRLSPGSNVADPACGVGGFLLEPLLNKRPHDLRSADSASLEYRGWDRDTKTIILAKANMLIHLSKVLEENPKSAPGWLAPKLNETFRSVASSITGSLSLAPREEFDLVMTNPPYVVTGTSTQREMIEGDSKLASYYSVRGSGVENLFLQLIVNGLKAGARGLVIVPDGLLLRHSEEALKRWLLQECILEAVISLPEKTFYSTPKKTYILSFRKKLDPKDVQTSPVFSYLVTDVGETLDAKRFDIDRNQLPRMADLFRSFQGAPDAFDPPDDEKRLKLHDIEEFQPEEHWLVDRWWSEDELLELGVVEAPEAISPEDLRDRIGEVVSTLNELTELLESPSSHAAVDNVTTVNLGDESLFQLSIGERVTKKELHGKPQGPVPLYSANVKDPFGFIEESNLDDFSHPSVIWGIDGDFELAVKEEGVKFAITDHCGRIEVLDSQLDASYCRAAIALARVYGFDRTLRPSLTRMRKLSFEVPVNSDGSFDLEAQKTLASRYDSVIEALEEADRAFEPLLDLQPDVMLPEEGEGGSGD